MSGKLGIIILTVWRVWLSYQVNQLFLGLIIIKNSPCYWITIADISTKMVFGCSQPREPFRVSNLYEYVCCASQFSLCIIERSPAGPCTWKVMSLPLALIRSTDSSRNCLSCWVLVPTEAPPEGLSLAQLCLHGLQPGRHLFLSTWTQVEVKLRHNDTETQCRMQTAESGIWLRCSPNSHMLHYRKEWSSQLLPRGPQSSSTHPFQISLDKSIRCK